MRRLILIAALAVAAPAQATTVFGLTFGQPLALPECVRDAAFPEIYATNQPAVCMQPSDVQGPEGVTKAYVAFSRASPPSMVSSLTIDVFLRDGALGGVEFSTAGVEDQEATLAELTAKYGRPDNLVRPTVQNRAGGTFTAIKATWSTPDIFVRYESAPVRLDLGEVTIETPAVKAARDAFYKARADQRTPL